MVVRPARFFAPALLLWAAIQSASAGAQTQPSFLSYRVTHSLYGEIGSYTNSIVRDGDMISVRNQVHLVVRVFGIVVHREDGDRVEQWRGDRLVGFHGVTTANGETAEIAGEARGDDFVVTSPQGTIVAPGNIRPSNPWSARVLESRTMLRTDTGAVETVRVSGPTGVTLKIDKASVETEEYDIAANPSYKIWLDDRQAPVKFTVADESGTVTFTLVEAR
jgi:hypothetical protein